ncbi:hypothetical protein Cci01nite_17430 [Catellatospora citrea]|uniref:Uncharacterized protein n=1 Tax=Catellatospora citrea TaxID=53366 RepID=A0A8J3KIP5_9ACTN|nr:hypothetical protein Cci01nite_17430 [Catellatospora citrea]
MKWTARTLIVAAIVTMFGMALAQPSAMAAQPSATATDAPGDPKTDGGNEWG